MFNPLQSYSIITQRTQYERFVESLGILAPLERMRVVILKYLNQ